LQQLNDIDINLIHTQALSQTISIVALIC
jgi:hypothetical protein